MRQAWRWFGPHDTVSISDIRQAGASVVVTALHHLPAGVAWSDDEIGRRQQEVAGPDGGSGLSWEVVESLPVSEAIKTRTGDWREHVAAWRAALEALARAGIETVCYNFMPVLDWTRTDLAAAMAHGGTAMRFDLVDFAVFDIHVLARPGAATDYPDSVAEAAAVRNRAMAPEDRAVLARNVTAGLPGAVEHWTLDGLRARIVAYSEIDAARLHRHHVAFLSDVVPTAERLGLRLCCHPDDPPFPLLGLPRVMSTAADYRALFDAVGSRAAGMTFCTGSFGARADNDAPAIVREFGDRIHFAHLRNVHRETAGVPCSFHESEHLAGDTDMVAVVAALLDEEARRQAEGRADSEIPMRPDHGQSILTDLGSGAQPGYPAVGRLKGLAELRGIMVALACGRPAQRQVA